MAYIERYNPYGHGQAPTAPAGDENGNIVGLELEISELTDEYYIEELIEDGFIGTEDSPNDFIQIEYEAQCNVEYEIIFNADDPEKILKRLQQIEGLSSDVVCNHDSSSHIHINRNWLHSIGVNELDYYHAAEAIAPMIYSVSGRDSYSWNKWCAEHIDLFNRSIKNRFDYIDGITPKNTGSYNDRYELCNCQNGSTIELRGFSNYYEFDADLIAFYIAIADQLIPNIALAMKDKSYANDWEEVIKTTSKFLKAFPHYVNRFNLDEWSNYEEMKRQQRREAIERAIKEYEEVQKKLETAKYYQDTDAPNALKAIAEILVLYRFIKVETIEMNAIKDTINCIEDQNQTHFKNTVWRS